MVVVRLFEVSNALWDEQQSHVTPFDVTLHVPFEGAVHMSENVVYVAFSALSDMT